MKILQDLANPHEQPSDLSEYENLMIFYLSIQLSSNELSIYRVLYINPDEQWSGFSEDENFKIWLH